MYTISASIILYFMGNSMGSKTDNVRKVCCVFITAECSVFIVWKFLYQSDTRCYRIIFWNMDDGSKTAINTIHKNGQQITKIRHQAW